MDASPLSAPKRKQPWWIWALIAFAGAMLIVFMVVVAFFLAAGTGGEPLPLEPAEAGKEEAALAMPADVLKRLEIWSASADTDGAAVEPKVGNHGSLGNVSFYAARRSGPGRPFTFETFIFGGLRGWAGRKFANLGVQAAASQKGDKTKKDLPPFGRQGYDAYLLCKEDQCKESVFQAYKGNRIYMLWFRADGPVVPSDPQGLADAMEAVLDGMKAYADAHPRPK